MTKQRSHQIFTPPRYTGGMYHDPDQSKPRRSGWLNKLLGQEAEDDAPKPAFRSYIAELGDTAEAAASATDPDPAMADLVALAEQLAGLIESAQVRLDGAVTLVDRSADEAAAYGRALAVDADRIGASEMPANMVEELIGLTRAMIARTQDAETRLRATNEELRGLQEDLNEAKETAERDPLTGLPNRRALEAALKRAVATAQATETALSVAFCDIDHFKRVNDVHGHAVGDRILRVVGDALAGDDDEGTFVGRQGGEEFVMLFSGLPVIEAAAKVDAIREALAARVLRSRSDGTPIGSVTFSAGVAALSYGESGEDLLQRADQALYRAKDGGRNQVVIDAGPDVNPADFI